MTTKTKTAVSSKRVARARGALDLNRMAGDLEKQARETLRQARVDAKRYTDAARALRKVHNV